jgi:hypothetical protein
MTFAAWQQTYRRTCGRCLRNDATRTTADLHGCFDAALVAADAGETRQAD